jgi:inosose dehydratase
MAGTGALALGATSLYSIPLSSVSAGKPVNPFSIGMAGYTFKEFTVEATIEMMKRIGVTSLSLKDFHMPMDSSQEQINAVIEKFRAAGITVYTVGVVYMKSEKAVDQAFDYAKMAGVKMIVGAPDYVLLPYVENKIKAYDFKLKS